MDAVVDNPAGSESLAGRYGEPDGVFDEMKAETGGVRPAWQPFVERLEALGAAEFEDRRQRGRRMIQDNGVTYNVYGDPRGMDRPWQLDPVPIIFSAAEWGRIEAGLIQRARLLNAVCADLYGPQRLLREKHVPAELILGHPNFLRPCHGLSVPKGRYLTIYAADLARAPDGRWWVLNDRAQAPSGAGYALENRLVVSRMLPGVFGDCRVTRLARFFAQFRDTLRAMSPPGRGGENPRIVLLTPGPFNETYFEHAYLARYLGFSLAQGDDLTVRDNKVYLKTLGGLRRVDVILRRLDDSYCDPLELRGDSAIGVPGLVQAAWAGNVAIANALGTGVLEARGLEPFYPTLCKTLLDEEEKLPGVATWWCGQRRERAYVVEHLHELVIKAAYPGAPASGLGGVPVEAIFGDTLTAAQREEVVGRIEDRPHAYAAQEIVNLSTTPVWQDGGLVPRHAIVRAYVAASDEGDGYAVMPGGLTRVSSTADSRVTSMQRGGGSKDTWVISDTPVGGFSLLRGEAGPAASVTDGSFDLPSRVADNLYWLGRYVERAENLVRLVRAVVARLTDDTHPGEGADVPVLLETLDALTMGKAGGRAEDQPEPAPAARLLAALFDPSVPYGLAESLTHIRRVASITRDRVSVDIWRILGQIARDFEEAAAQAPIGQPSDAPLPPRGAGGRSAANPPSGSNGSNGSPAPDPARRSAGQNTPPLLHGLGDALDFLDGMVTGLAAFTGLGTESMLRNQGWRFLDMGRRVERADNSVALLRALAARTVFPGPEGTPGAGHPGAGHPGAGLPGAGLPGGEGVALDALLEVMASAMSYRQRYLAAPSAVPVIDMLLLEETNPRAVAYQLVRLEEHLDRVPRTRFADRRGEDQRRVLELLTRLRLAEPAALAAVEDGRRPALDAVAEQLAAALPRLSDAIARQFLSHNPVTSRLGARPATTADPAPG